jgi:hypothetical protein
MRKFIAFIISLVIIAAVGVGVWQLVENWDVIFNRPAVTEPVNGGDCDGEEECGDCASDGALVRFFVN